MKKNLLFVLASISNFAFAQWNPNPAINNAVCVTPNNQVNVKIVSDMKGGAIVVWEDYRNDPTFIKSDIYAQHIDAFGNPKWTANGVVICNDTSHQSGVTMVSDSSGGAIIVWQDHRNPKRNLYAQRVDSSGNILWTANGVGVTLRNFDQQRPKVLNDGSHGAIVLWQDSVGGNYDIYGQRLDPNGAQLWSTGVAVCAFPLSQVNVKAQITPAGDIYTVWQDKRNGSDYDIYVQKLNLSGVAQWTANGINICNLAGNQANPKISMDATGDAVIVWQDKRNGLDYDIYAQRINPSGVAQWSANGVGICTLTGSTQSAPDLNSQFMPNGTIFVWQDKRAGISNTDVYAQKLNSSGAIQWASNGIVIANANAKQMAPNIITDGAGGGIIAFQDSSAGNWDVRAQRVSATGALLWTAGGMSVGTAAGDQINQSNISAGVGNSIYAFQDMRSGNYDIYIYKLDSTGASIGITQLSGIKENISVYPNPSADKITFSFADQNENRNIVITDINGKEILREEIGRSANYSPAKKLESGIYFYNINSATTQYRGKIIIAN
jgi:hypothetical protein